MIQRRGAQINQLDILENRTQIYQLDMHANRSQMNHMEYNKYAFLDKEFMNKLTKTADVFKELTSQKYIFTK